MSELENIELPEDAEVIDLKAELPEDIKNSLKELQEKYGLETSEDLTSNTTDTPITPMIERTLLSNITKRINETPGEAHLSNGEIKYRKWKVKDKKYLDKSKTMTDMKYALVYNCLENNPVVDNEEFNFLLHKIRYDSVHKPLINNFSCPNCGHIHRLEIRLENIVKSSGGDYELNGKITISDGDKDINVEFGSPLNQEIYDEFMYLDDLSDFQMFMTDMVLHIKKIDDLEINDRDGLIEVIKLIDDLDADVADNLVEEWNKIRFKTVIDNDIECPECHNMSKYNFEDVPGFYPPSWNDWNL